MRPYHPHIGPDLGGEISAKASNAEHAVELWKAAVATIIYDALLDNFETENVPGVGALEGGDKARAMAIGNAALEKVLAPLAQWTGHDWIGQTLGVADPTDDEAMSRLFQYAAKTSAHEAALRGIEAKGSPAKFMSSEHVIPKGKKVTQEDHNKPFIDFLAHVVAQASDTFGDEWVAAKLAENTPEAADTLLQCAGYELNDNNRASLAHAIKLLPPDKTAANVASIQEAPAAQDFATARAEGMEAPAAASGGLTVEQAVGVIRTKSGLGDPDIGALLGVSRGTVGNVAVGKAKKPLTSEGKLALAAKVAEIISDLTAAKNALEA